MEITIMSQSQAATVEPNQGERKIRVLIAKPGLDGHDRGAKVVTRGLRDAGMEVIYTGLHQTPEMIVEAALQEDVDVIGLSILSGAHNVLFPRIINLLKQNGMDDVLVFAGGIIPPEDVPEILNMGIRVVFGPGTTIEETAKFIQENVRPSSGLGSPSGEGR
jgi:methylmalonyl-CoA mutase C-terminal domain/subunit